MVAVQLFQEESFMTDECGDWINGVSFIPADDVDHGRRVEAAKYTQH